MKIPNVFRYLFYITPFYLGAILLYWALFNWVPWIVKPFGIDMSIDWINKYPWINITQKVCEKNPLILYTRGGLLLLIILLLAMIFTAWKLKKNKGGVK